MKKTYRIFLLIIFIPASIHFSQTKSNLSVFEDLIGQSVSKMDSAVVSEGGEKNVKVSLPSSLEPLMPFLVSSFKEKGFAVNSKSENIPLQNYTLINAAVVYKNSFRDGWFGDISTEREVHLEGAHFALTADGLQTPVHFAFSNIDSVKVDEIPMLENKTAPFTHAQIPDPPVLSSIYEPVIVVGTLITTVILLFTVRSK